jgi:hypothetical protein
MGPRTRTKALEGEENMLQVRGIETRSTRCPARYKATAERMTRKYITCSFIRENTALLFYFWAAAYTARDFGVAGTENSFLYFLHAACTRKTRKFLPQNSITSFETKTTL